MLGKGIDWLKQGARPCAVPIRFQLIAMESGPLRDELERTARKVAAEHLAVERDRGRMVSDSGWK